MNPDPVPTVSKVPMYAVGAAGFGVGFLLSGMFLRLSDRLRSFMHSVFNRPQRAGQAPGPGPKWADWVGWLLAFAFWFVIAVVFTHRAMKSDHLGNAFLAGLGWGGVVEELFQIPGGL